MARLPEGLADALIENIAVQEGVSLPEAAKLGAPLLDLAAKIIGMGGVITFEGPRQEMGVPGATPPSEPRA